LSTVGAVELKQDILGFTQVFNDILQLTESNNIITGIVKYISDTVGITGTSVKFRLVSFGIDAGNFITTSVIDLSNFITSTQQNVDDMIGFTSFDSGDMIVDNG
jgi:hypothetical protein